MKRLLLFLILLTVVGAGLACGPVQSASPTPVFIPLPTAQATGQAQGQRPAFTPGAGPAASGTPRAGAGNPQAMGARGSITPTAGSEPVFTLPEPTRTPVPTPTSVAARFLATPTPTPIPPPPAPRPPLQGRLVFQTSSGGDINIINMDGTGLRTLTHGLDPAWSPDGKQVAFTRWDGKEGLYVINADGTGERLVIELHQAKSPAWSPDGTKIVVTTSDTKATKRRWGGTGEKTIWQLVGVNVADGSLLEDITVDSEWYAFCPTWSSKGFIAYEGSRGLYVTAQGAERAEVVGNTPRPDSPAWSPDGNRLAFMMWQNDHWDIFTMNPDGSQMAILTPPEPFLKRVPNNVAPSWSPDGRYIIFLSDRDGLNEWHVYVMNADGSDQHRLMDLPITYDFASERVFSWAR